MPKLPKKLIEVALPLDDINAAAAREKSIRHGHPSTLHLWWARRPLAAARAVLFAQLVNDPGSTYEGDKRTKEAKKTIHAERERLFEIIRDLVQWENSTDEIVLEKARAEIRKSWAYTCAITGDDPEKMPPVLDPFCGGGSIPLEAQRLGMEAHGSDLNPVPTLISKSLTEIPQRFEGKSPIRPTNGESAFLKCSWSGAQGLAEDILHYGGLLRNEAWSRLERLYPKVALPEDCGGGDATVVAWIWARTVPSPNPAFAHVHIPLISSYLLSAKKGKEAWIEPVVEGDSYHFLVHRGVPANLPEAKSGTKAGTRGHFRCLVSGSPLDTKYIRKMATRGKMGYKMIAIVAEGSKGKVFCQASEEQERAAGLAQESWKPETATPKKLTGGTCHGYGLTTFGDLFTTRQLCTLNTLCDTAAEISAKARADALGHGWELGLPLERGGNGALAYSQAIAVYLSFLIDQVANHSSTLCGWNAPNTQMRSVFSRQAIAMTWDFAECNVFSDSSGSFNNLFERMIKGLTHLSQLSELPRSCITKDDATTRPYAGFIVSTDPPYYDNIAYADLSDFFYVWLRRNLLKILPDTFATMSTPKDAELVAAAYRHGGKDEAHGHFMNGMVTVFGSMAQHARPDYPISIYYAFKQSETASGETASSGWESFLQAVIGSGLSVSGTWPLRTEKQGRSVGVGTNALAASIVLACRPRPKNADEITRRQFQRELNQQLPDDLDEMIHGTEGVSPIAPVDLAQAAIGPGMAIFSQYKAVLEADGSPMSVHNALIMINKAIDEYFDAAEGSMDGLTRFCAQWVQQYGFKTGPYGEADGISRACGVSADGHPEAIESGKGKVRLRPAKEYDREASPEMGKTSIWICLHSIAARLEKDGTASAGAYLAVNPGAGPDIRNLAYRLYTICERAKLADHARTYNNVVTSWDAICEASREAGHAGEQQDLFKS